MGKPEQLGFDLEATRFADQEPVYFTKHDLLGVFPDLLPEGMNWQEMLVQGKVYSPTVVSAAIAKAWEFLRSQPGPHQSERAYLAERWFGSWHRIFRFPGQVNGFGGNYVSSAKVLPFDRVYKAPDVEKARILFMGGGAGHEGHQHLVREAANTLRTSWLGGPVVVCLEPDSYFTRPEVIKPRKGRFLPLELIVSMWSHYPWSDLVTVSPDKPAGEGMGAFYERIFEELVGGPDRGYCLAQAEDENREAKIRRGRGATLASGAYSPLVISHLPVARTSFRVSQLLPTDLYDDETLSETWDGLTKC